MFLERSVMVTSQKECSALCKNFKCSKQPSALKFLQKRGARTAWCTWIDEECDGAWCQFSKCIERRMLDDGTCKPLTKKAVETMISSRDDEYPDAIPKDIAKKFRIK
jgi:hypothetical protein